MLSRIRTIIMRIRTYHARRKALAHLDAYLDLIRLDNQDMQRNKRQ